MYVDEEDILYLGDLVDQLLFVVLHFITTSWTTSLSNEYLDVDVLHVQGSVIISTEVEGTNQMAGNLKSGD